MSWIVIESGMDNEGVLHARPLLLTASRGAAQREANRRAKEIVQNPEWAAMSHHEMAATARGPIGDDNVWWYLAAEGIGDNKIITIDVI